MIDKIYLALAAALMLLIIPLGATAASDAPQGIGAAGGKLTSMKSSVGLSSDVSSFTENILMGAFSLLGTVFFVLLIYGGFVWIKSSGRDEEVARAKRIIATSVIGLAIIMASYAITAFVLARAMGSSSTGTGGSSNPGCCHTYCDGCGGNDWNVMSESACVATNGYMDWKEGSCEQ